MRSPGQLKCVRQCCTSSRWPSMLPFTPAVVRRQSQCPSTLAERKRSGAGGCCAAARRDADQGRSHGKLPPHRRPYYAPRERLAILEVRAARGWSLEQTAESFLVTPKTVA